MSQPDFRSLKHALKASTSQLQANINTLQSSFHKGWLLEEGRAAQEEVSEEHDVESRADTLRREVFPKNWKIVKLHPRNLLSALKDGILPLIQQAKHTTVILAVHQEVFETAYPSRFLLAFRELQNHNVVTNRIVCPDKNFDMLETANCLPLPLTYSECEYIQQSVLPQSDLIVILGNQISHLPLSLTTTITKLTHDKRPSLKTIVCSRAKSYLDTLCTLKLQMSCIDFIEAITDELNITVPLFALSLRITITTKETQTVPQRNYTSSFTVTANHPRTSGLLRLHDITAECDMTKETVKMQSNTAFIESFTTPFLVEHNFHFNFEPGFITCYEVPVVSIKDHVLVEDSTWAYDFFYTPGTQTWEVETVGTVPSPV